MKRWKIYLLVLSIILSNTSGLFAQSNSPYTPSIVPPSPNAASLGKFGDIPVSPYTGTTDVSVPIYTIQAKGVTVPISLSYHTGGVRLAEEAGWVGLGWALNAGGMISRSINDKDDWQGYYYNSDLTVPVPDVKGIMLPHSPYPEEPYLGPWGYFFYCTWNITTDQTKYYNYNFWQNIMSTPSSYDLEPDSYSFNIPGHSGKFIISRDRKIILQKQENLKIQCPNDGSYFVITDDQGNAFYFNDLESCQPLTGGASHTSSWLLSKIVTQQKDSVMFSYSFDGTWTSVKGTTQESDRWGVQGAQGTTYSNDPGQSYYNRILQQIDYKNVQVQFSFDGSRTDVQNGKKLNSIKIYSNEQSGLKYLKEEQLYYSYFNPSTISTDLTESLRLRLDSVKEISGASSMPPYKFYYNMPATMQNLMGKHYSSVDHWGYFNGAANAVFGNYALGFIPPYLGIVNGSVLVDLPGANREPNDAFMNAFSLNKVSYPTGGYTLLDFESNSYDHAKSTAGYGGRDFEQTSTVTKTKQFIINTNGTTTGTIDFSNIFYTSWIDALTGLPVVTNGTIAVAFQAANSDSLNFYHNSLGYGKINFTFNNNTTDISSNTLYCNGAVTNGNCSGTVYSASVPMAILTKSVFNWSAYIDPIVKIGGGLQNIVVTFTWKEALFDNTTMLTGGGLRVKMVSDYNADGKIAKKRVYDYSYQEDRNGDGIRETYSYGRLMGFLSYGRSEVIDISETNHGVSFTRFASSNTSSTSMSSGNVIGYDQVAEYTIDPETSVDIGKTVYTFNNSSDTTWAYAGFRFPGVSNLPNNLNGLPLSKTIFSRLTSGYKKVSAENFYYRSANRIIYDALKYQRYTATNIYGPGTATCGVAAPRACECPGQIDSVVVDLIANYYPAMSSEVILLDSSSQTVFDQNDTTIQLTTVTRNYYDNPKHYLPTRTNIIDSKNNTNTSLIKYPQDYIPNGNTITNNTILDTMINKNMINTTVEKRDSFYYSGSSTGYVKSAQLSTFKILNSKSVAFDKQYQLDVQSPVTNFVGFAISGNTTSKDSRYRQMISFDAYDNFNNITQYTLTDQLPMSVIWDYKNIYPVAQVKKAFLNTVAFTSFEADGKGNWTFSGAANADASSPGGNNCYNLAGGNIAKSSLTSTSFYIVSYWRKTASALTITGTQAGYPKQGKTINGWTYYEHLITGVTSVTISGTNYIDELRLFPSNAQMTTYTYAPLVGMTSASDLNNKFTYYFYDEFQRLKWIKDQDQNIIKTFRYHYLNQGAPNNQ